MLLTPQEDLSVSPDLHINVLNPEGISVWCMNASSSNEAMLTLWQQVAMGLECYASQGVLRRVESGEIELESEGLADSWEISQLDEQTAPFIWLPHESGDPDTLVGLDDVVCVVPLVVAAMLFPAARPVLMKYPMEEQCMISLWRSEPVDAGSLTHLHVASAS